MDKTVPNSVLWLLAEAKNLPDQERIPFLKKELAKLDEADRDISETFVLNQLMHGNRTVVVFIHGINTHAEWQERFRSILSKDSSIEVVIIKYGWLGPLSFLLPFTRALPIRKVLGQLRNIQKKHRNADIVLVTHSFGTYIIGNILKKHPDILAHRLILSGSVLPENFAWDFLPTKPVSILNDIGAKDRWPIYARTFSVGYGASGSYGFGHHMVTDRYHDCDHSGFFEKSFLETFWVPYIKNGEKVDSSFERKSPSFVYDLLPYLVKSIYVFLIYSSVTGFWR